MVKHLAIAFVLVLSSVARADTDDVDPETAQRLAILGSAIPAAAIGLGTFVALDGTKAPIRDVGSATAITGALVGLVTPSIGAFYSHRAITGGIGLRVAGIVAETIGLTKLLNSEIGDCEDPSPCHHPASTYVLLASGAALYFGGMALDIVHAPEIARDWNQRYELQLVPTTIRSGGSTTTGVALAGRF
jgi:hypothetical protein